MAERPQLAGTTRRRMETDRGCTACRSEICPRRCDGRLATERRLPSMLMQKQDVEAGGLMSYFADHRELWRRIAFYVDRLLKGAAPSELPFELPTRFELVLNLKTARALEIVLPTSLVARADDVIE
jgi:putative ABC transport system substrate-binding protein